MKEINNTLILKTNIENLLNEKNISQKELAKIINEREASISELINLKRTTINIALLLKIAKCLQVNSIEDLMELEYVFGLPSYKPVEFHTFPYYPGVRFSYSCSQSEIKFETVELVKTEGNSQDTLLINNKYDLMGKDYGDIREDFDTLQLDWSPDEMLEESGLISMLIELCRYKGENVLSTRFKTKQDAIDTLELLY